MNGSYFETHYFPLRNEQGEVVEVIGVSTDITEQKQAQSELTRYTAQLQGLAQASAVINASLSVSEILATVTEQAQTIIGAHQAVISLAEGEDCSHPIQHVSLSDKYAAWRDYDEKPIGSGICTLVCQTNQPMRLTQAELEAHPAWRSFGRVAGRHPPLRGWLAVPLIERDGRNMGLLQLSDKYEGNFTVDDEAIVVQLVQVAEVAIENARLLEAERTAQEQLRNLTRYLHAVREVERTDIAREIHDELGQALTALKMDLSWLAKRLPDEPMVRQRAAATTQLINSTIQTVQHIATELRPGLLDDLGLVPALEWQAHEFSERTGIDCQLDLDELTVSLGRERDTAVFRIFQETLTNIARHAGATLVEIELKESPEGLILTVQDNGRGITQAQLAAPTSLGLLGMRERARSWGGKVTFADRSGGGTQVSLYLPPPSEANQDD
jgi:signal transduction histidine kinase